ncbi:MAG TPA: LuxR C-terminal-related transcriptional regulator [Actinomycetota bacterium]
MDEDGVALIAPESPDGERPPDDELEVMRLIVSGLTDHAIARRVGVSVITVRRRAARIRRRLGASTRIEAAVLAAKRGWL